MAGQQFVTFGLGSQPFGNVPAWALDQNFNDATNFPATTQIRVAADTRIPRSHTQKLADWVSVKDFGAKGDGVTDDTFAFNNAQIYANSINASVYLPSPDAFYLLAGTVTVLTSMRGTGYATVIKTSSATADVFQITDPGCVLEDFWLTSTVTRTAGYFINSIGVNYTRLQRLGLINWFNGVGLTGGACTTFRLVDCSMSTNVVGGIGVTISTAVNAVDVLLRDVYIVGPTSGAQCAAGIQVTNVGDLTLEHVETVKCGTGFNIQPGAGQVIQCLYCSNSLFDSGSGTGVQFNMQSTGTVQLAKFVNCWAVTNANGFVLSASSAGTCTNAEFINCIGSNNVGGVGFQIVHSGVTNTNVIGGSYALNAYGVYINTSVTRFNLMGIRIGASGQFGNNTINGLVLAGSNDQFTILGCDVTNNATPYAITAPVGGTPGQTWYIKDCPGIVTSSGGQATLTSAATTTTVTHGLAGTPRLQDVTITPNSGAGTGVFYAVTSVTATNFVITAQANPGAGVLMGWNARLWGA